MSAREELALDGTPRSERQRRHDALTRPERTQALVRDLHADLDYYRSE